jgi:serine phosphatase RsbU (regulator of sigma subunit)
MSTDPLAPAGDSAPTRTGAVTRIAMLVCAALVVAASAIPLLAPRDATHGRAYAGLVFLSESKDSTKDSRPGLITKVESFGPAWLAGIPLGDRVQSIGGVPISDRAGLESLAARLHPGDLVTFRVLCDSVVRVSSASDSLGASGRDTPTDSVAYEAGRAAKKLWLRLVKPRERDRRVESGASPPLRHIRRHFKIPREIPVRLGSLSLTGARLLDLAIELLAATAFLALGLVVFTRRPADLTATLFFLLSACGAAGHVLGAGLWYRSLSGNQGLLPTSASAFGGLGNVLPSTALGLPFLVLLLHFTLVFPKERPVLSQRPDVLRWIYVLSAVLTMLCGSVVLAIDSTTSGASPWVRHWALALGVAVGAAAVAVVSAATRVGPPPADNRPRLLTRPGLTGLGIAFLCALSLAVLSAIPPRGTTPSVGGIVVLFVELAIVLLGFLALAALLVSLTVASIVCLLRSYREGGAEARRQIRWPLWGLATAMGLTAVNAGVDSVLFVAFRTTWAISFYRAAELADGLFRLLIPASFAIAILKYRLMEIDVVIRRTVVYAALTGLLVAVYAVLVGGVGSILGQAARTHSHWPTAFGTMAVAMVFFPARNRIQSLVDRRFFRTRFVAAESLQRMSAVVSTTTQVPALMHAAVEEAQQALQSRTAAGFTFQPESHALAVVETIGLPDERRRELRLVLDETAIGALRSGAQLDFGALTGGLAALARLAGAVLLVPITHRGELRGLLTVGTKLSDQQIEPADREFLAAVAAQTGAGLANVESGARQRELEEARVIQAGLLPAELPVLPGFDLAAYWQPAREVAGDLYDVFPVGERFALCIADVTGKGMPAALLMSSLQATLRGAASLGLAPGPLIERVNRTMSTQMAAGRFATLFYAVLDPARHVLRYVNAGHNPPMLLRAGGTCETLGIGGLLIGVFPEARYEEADVTLHAGDRLLLYTDGITEAQNAAGDLFEEERLERELRGLPDGDAAAIQRRIIAATGEFCGGEWQDDATLVVLLTR